MVPQGEIEAVAKEQSPFRQPGCHHLSRGTRFAKSRDTMELHASSPTGKKSASSAGPLVLLTVFAILILPQFVRMPLTNDAEMYDLQAHLLRQGGVLYRDVLEPNLPGVVWVHYMVRSLFGERSEALKFFDLAVFAGILVCAAKLV